MVQLPADLPFDAWLEYLFGPPVSASGFRESDDWWDEQRNPTLAVEHLTRLFDSPEDLLARFAHDQINRGFWFLLGESGHLQPLLGPRLPWEPRRRGLLAIGSLYERLFAPACTRHLGHLDHGAEPPNPLNSICYMWWDLFPTWGGHGGEQRQRAADWGKSRRARRRDRHRALAVGAPPSSAVEASLRSVDETLLHVMQQTLHLESEPCREGALHGLGHWHLSHPERTAAIIDTWLAGQPAIGPELRRYAEQARAGCVL